MIIILLALISFGITFGFSGCDYARMREQESIRTYEAQPPEMPLETIPATGGVEELRSADPKRMSNPLPPARETIERGKRTYNYFCVFCHGPEGDGNGTVGQSFAPLPTDLRSAYVQNQKDGSLFYRIIFGFKRHPPLYATIDYEDGWAVVHYIRSLGRAP